MAQMAITLLTRAIEYDMNGRKLESLKLYEDGIEALLKESKGTSLSVSSLQRKTIIFKSTTSGNGSQAEAALSE